MKNFLFVAIGVVLSLGIVFFGGDVLVQSAPLHLQVSDTIAGYETTISTTYAKPYEEIIFYTEDPSGVRREFSTKSNSTGYAQVTISGAFTRIAGKYSATAVRDGQMYNDGPVFSFTVFSESISNAESTLTTPVSSVSVGNTASVVVHTVDKYGNPIAGKFITLIPSRPSDQIFPETVQTNERGEAIFQITALQEGTSTFSALEKMSGIALKNTASIFFFSTTPKSPNWSSRLSASLVTSQPQEVTSPKSVTPTSNFGEASSFSIKFPNEVAVNSDQQYLTIQVLDKNGQIVKNYAKQILIKTPDDPQSTLPGQGGKYTFVADDQGEFTFPLALIFSKIGSQRIEVYEYDTVNQKINPSISGSKIVSVIEKTGNPPPGSPLIRLNSPQQNSKFGSGEISLLGTAQQNSDIKVFLDDIVSVELPVDAKGEFKGVLKSVKDGKHTVYVMQKEGLRETSSVISFEVDTTFPELLGFQIYPEEAVESEAQVLFSAQSEPGLDIAKITVNGEPEFLKESITKPGTYELTTSAPKNEGTYDITISLIDRVGNTTTKIGDKKLQVKERLLDTPPAPKNFKATPLAGGAELSWDAMTEISPKVVMYIIHSGKDEQNITRAKSVSGETTSITIDGLTPGEKRFFAISAINMSGKEGPKTPLIEVIPLTGEITPTPTEEPTHSAPPSPYTLKAISAENSVVLSWTAFKTNPESYTIEYGVEPNKYRASRKISANITDLVVEDLIPGREYYFRVFPVGKNGESLSEQYEPAKATPIGKSGYQAPAIPLIAYPNKNSDTGPAFFLFIGTLFFCGGIIFYFFRQERAHRLYS